MLGAPSELKTDTDGLNKIKEHQGLVESHANKTFSTFEPVGYTTQVVAGTNYQAVVKVGEDEHIHVKIYEPLPGQGDNSVSGFKEGVNANDAFDF